MSATSEFQYHLDRHQLLVVGVDDINILLPGSNEIAIGTYGLNGCTCVAIMGPKAILLAHISPLPNSVSARDWAQVSGEAQDQARHDHHQWFLEGIEQLVKKHAARFPIANAAWVIIGNDPEKGLLKASLHQIERHLTTMGFIVQRALYNEVDPWTVSLPRGEVVGVRRPGGLASPYGVSRLGDDGLCLDNTLLWPKRGEPLITFIALSASTPSRPQPQEPMHAAYRAYPTPSRFWTWSQAQQHWDFVVQGQPGQGWRHYNEWPRTQGRIVFCLDDETWRWYNCDTNRFSRP